MILLLKAVVVGTSFLLLASTLYVIGELANGKVETLEKENI